MTAWLDISIPLKNGLPAWPGDEPFHRALVSEIGVDGALCEVSTLTMCAHTGTHVDAPRHFVAGGAGIDALDIALLVGPAYLLDLSGGMGHITAVDLDGRLPQGVARLLLKTRGTACATDCVFHDDFRALTVEASGYLARAGVRLLGIDAPSIAPFASPVDAHRVFLGEQGSAALENINLNGAVEGWYDLICLPLPVAGGDGAPARALIRAREAWSNAGE